MIDLLDNCDARHVEEGTNNSSNQRASYPIPVQQAGKTVVFLFV
jgi:hypothetical protein